MVQAAVRTPFLGLILGAVTGILLSDISLFHPAWFASAFFLSLLGLVIRISPKCFWYTIIFGFATWHSCQIHQHPGRALAVYLKETPVPLRVIGIVSSEPRELEASLNRPYRSSFYLKTTHILSPEISIHTSFKLFVTWTGPPPAIGDQVQVFGLCENIPPPRNPGQFNQRRFLERHHIFSRLNVRYSNDARILAPGVAYPLLASSIRMRQRLERVLCLDLEDSPDISAIITGMLLGVTADLSLDQMDAFNRSGTIHLFSVSGLHVSILASIFVPVLSMFLHSRKYAVLIFLPILIYYAFITGLRPPVLRATAMTALVLVGYLLERPPVVFNSLAAAGFLILLADTNQIFLAGFQLSFTIVAAIILFVGPLTGWGKKFTAPDPFIPKKLLTFHQRFLQRWGEKFAGMVAVSLTSWLGALPLTFQYFHLFNPVSILANLFVIPLAFLVVALGSMAILFSFIHPLLVVLVNNSNWAVCHAIVLTVTLTTKIPGGSQYLYMGPARPTCKLTIFDVQDGQAIAFQTPEKFWLLDAASTTHFNTSVRRYLQSQGINRLDGILLSHGDTHHIGGAVPAHQHFYPQTILDSLSSDRSPARKTLAPFTRSFTPGETVFLSPDIFLECFYPDVDNDQTLSDDDSLILLLQLPGFRILFTSDHGFHGFQFLWKTVPRADMLVMNRCHDEYLPPTQLLNALGVRYLVLNDSPIAPVPATQIAEWARSGIQVFQQVRTGALTLHYHHPQSIYLKPYLSPSIIPLNSEVR